MSCENCTNIPCDDCAEIGAEYLMECCCPDCGDHEDDCVCPAGAALRLGLELDGAPQCAAEEGGAP